MEREKEPRDELIAREEERLEETTGEYEKLLDGLGLTRDKLKSFLSDRSQFTPADWEKMEEMRGTFEEELQKKLPKRGPKPSPSKSRSSLSSIQPTWIFVR